MEVLWIRKWRVLEAPMQTVSLGLHASYTIELQKEMGMTTNLIDGYSLQVGDAIVAKHAFGNNRHVVTRVTPKYAFVQYNDVCEGKYPRIFDRSFSSLPRPKWMTIDYSIEKAKP